MSAANEVRAGKASYAFWQNLKGKLFWIVGGALVFTVSYIYYNNMNKPTAGTLTFLGGFLALYYYYVKFFIVDANKKDWPPYQSTCPDFLTLIPPGSGYAGSPSDFLCVDFVGVSINGGLKKADPANIATQINDPSYVFKVNMDRYASKGGVKKLKKDLSDAGLSWEAMLKGSSISIPTVVEEDDTFADEDDVTTQ